jgi:HSP20 family protein
MPSHSKLYSFPLRLHKELDRLFEEIIHRPWGLRTELLEWRPAVDLYETPEAFILDADLPGVRREDVKVEVEGNKLLLQGRRSSDRSYRNGRFCCQERSFGDFFREVPLPESVDKDRIKADFSAGVLRVILPKLAKTGSSL